MYELRTFLIHVSDVHLQHASVFILVNDLKRLVSMVNDFSAHDLYLCRLFTLVSNKY